jgi:hypothetical protein
MAAKPKDDVAPEAVVEETPEPTVEERLGDADPYEYVRAKDADHGAEYTTTRVAALSAGARILDKPATDQFGQIIPTKTVLDLRAEALRNDVVAGRSDDDLPKEN